MKRLLITLLAIVALMSCHNGSVVTPVASGRPYEMLLVIDKDDWDAPLGTSLREVLTSDIPGLPQSEAMFRLSHVAPTDFDRTFQLFRNILIVDIDPAVYTKVSIHFTTDEYADGQVIMSLRAASKS